MGGYPSIKGRRAHLAELVDALDLGSSGFGCGGSSPPVGIESGSGHRVAVEHRKAVHNSPSRASAGIRLGLGGRFPGRGPGRLFKTREP
jgi:hypothetical protein